MASCLSELYIILTFLQDLKTARLEAAKRDVLRAQLRSLANRSDTLPGEVLAISTYQEANDLRCGTVA